MVLGGIRILGVAILIYGASDTVPDLKIIEPCSSSIQFCTGGQLPSAEGASTGGRISIYASLCLYLSFSLTISILHGRPITERRRREYGGSTIHICLGLHAASGEAASRE